VLTESPTTHDPLVGLEKASAREILLSRIYRVSARLRRPQRGMLYLRDQGL